MRPCKHVDVADGGFESLSAMRILYERQLHRVRHILQIEM